MVYLAPNPVKDLEDWFLNILRAEFPESVYVLIGYKDDEEGDPVPYDYVRVIYTGLTTSDNSNYIEQRFGFKIIYSCHLPATMLPHRRSLALMEKGRVALWQKIPPRPADTLPLLLKSEKLVKSKDCDCGPAYSQEWQAYNRVSNILVPIGNPCVGAGEPDIYIPNPLDLVTPLDDEFYIKINPNFETCSLTQPIGNGTNQPYNWINNTWVKNSAYNRKLPTVWGCLPFILERFIKSFEVSVQTPKSQLLAKFKAQDFI